MSVDVTVTIATWNRAELVLACLDALARSTGIAFEVIVIDNGSTDDTRAVVRARHPAVTLIESPTNEGYAAANNRGIERARGRYVLVLNNDAAVEPDTLAQMVKFMDARPAVGAAICTIYPAADAERPVPCAHRYFPSARRVLATSVLRFTGLEFLLRRLGLADRLEGRSTDFTHEQRVEHITGCFLFVRRATIDQVGPMDPEYFLYLEETDWCYRMRRAGWEIAYTPDTRAVHLESRTTGALPDRAEIYRRSMERFLNKHRGAVSAWIYRWQVRLIDRPLSPLFDGLRNIFRS